MKKIDIWSDKNQRCEMRRFGTQTEIRNKKIKGKQNRELGISLF